MDDQSMPPLGYEANEAPLRGPLIRPRRRWPLRWYLLTLTGLTVVWVVVALINALFLSGVEAVAAGLGRRLPQTTIWLIEFGHWWNLSLGWLAAVVEAVVVCGVGVWIDRRADNDGRIKRYALIVLICSLLLALLYALWMCFCVALLLPGVARALGK